MKKLTMETGAAIVSALCAAVAVIVSIMNWHSINLADDNMIEHEVFSRQVNHCLDQFDAASSYFGSYLSYARLAQEANRAEKSGDTNSEAAMLSAANKSAEELGAWYSQFSGSVLRDSMLIPDNIAEAERHLDDAIKALHQPYLDQDLEKMVEKVNDGRFPSAIRVYRDNCRSYFSKKKLVLPDGK